MQLHIYKTPDDLINELAKWIGKYINTTLKKQDHFTFALSGGETPKALYSLLSSDVYRNKINWNKIHFFWGDERVVPFTDKSNNAKMAFDTLLSHVTIPAENIHVIKTGIAPEASAKEYEIILHQYFDKAQNTFDLVLLGMGKDAHTLSLFPSSPILNEHEHWVNSVYVEDQKMYRITLMPSVVNKSSQVIFLISGAEKAEALHNVLEASYQPEKYPAQLIKPANGELHWFLDEAAEDELK